MPPLDRALIRLPARVLAAALLLAALGCREDDAAPSAPEAEPAAAAVTAPLVFRQITAGGSHSCGVTYDDRAYCWGSNNSGQLGVGIHDGPEICLRLGCSRRPVPVLGGLHFRQLSAGGDHTCGMPHLRKDLDDAAYCWGYNSIGALGDGTTIHRTKPRPVVGP
jgi:alpha-tubulin suppressor-like RCC1 family protein